ncbi:MAG: NADPH-dependent F420 reductase [Flavisolibacter sp.]
MASKKTIAIIGATGNMGSAIARSLAKGNYRLLLFGRDHEKVQHLIDEIKDTNPDADIDSMGCPFDASWEADIIIPAVEYKVEKEVAESIKDVATQKIVISISNPLNESHDGLVTAPDTSAAEELQAYLPDSKIVKAFNTVFAGDFSQPVIDGKQVDVLIAGNDEESVQAVSDVVAHTGFNPVVAGGLSTSRTLENMTALLIQLNSKYKYNWVGGWKVLHN